MAYIRHMASKHSNDKQYASVAICKICESNGLDGAIFEHGMPRHMKMHRENSEVTEAQASKMAFNCQAKCAHCKSFTKTNGFVNGHYCQSCWNRKGAI